MLRNLKYVLTAIAVLIALMPCAYAKHSGGSGTNVNVSINVSDRGVINDYLRANYQPAHCPPGLAKKNNGCLPPGIAKKYHVGQALPETVAYEPLPDSIVIQLHPPVGYQYVKVDQDVLLIGEASKKVIDAVTLLSAVH